LHENEADIYEKNIFENKIRNEIVIHMMII